MLNRLLKLKIFNARVLLTFGLVSLVASALLGAMFVGAVPDRQASERASRASLSETVAASLMIDLAEGRLNKAQALIDFVRERNPELVSIALREVSGTIAAKTGTHEPTWVTRPDGRSTETHVIVPLAGKNGQWGQAELQFQPISKNAIWFWQADERIQILAIVLLLCSFSFYFYLGRMLKQLDPSRAVPDRVKSALDTLSEGLILLDTNSNIVLANQAFSGLVGQSQEALLGQPVNSLPWQLPKTNLGLNTPWSLTLASGKTQLNVPMQMTDPQKKLRSFQVNCAPVFSEKNKVGGVLISLADVTELQEKELALVESKAAADSANRAKTDFLANMSHEIRTPMNAVLGFTDLLRRGAFSDAAQATKYLNTVHNSGKHLLGLINDILDLSKVEAGKLEVERIETATHEVIAQTIETLRVRANEKNIGISFAIDGAIPSEVMLDPGRVRQIVTNLTGNAIKFTEKGAVKIIQRWSADAKDSGKSNNGTMIIDVIDSGIGIPADKLAGIFDPFSQAESSTTRRFGGTGLGLSISRKFAQALGGNIEVFSQLGKGSCFRVTLKATTTEKSQLLYELPAAKESVEGEVNNSVRFESSRILVADDSPENRMLMRAVLEPMGLIVDEAENGQVALEQVAKTVYPLIFMDMQMPVMDGFTATKTLRQQGFRGPIVAFTAHALKGFEEKIQQSGCSEYLTKPIDLDLLLAVLKKHLPYKTTTKQKFDSTPKTLFKARLNEGSPLATTAPQTSKLVSRLANLPNLHAVINIFITRMPKQLFAIQGACEQSNWDELAGLAHWLKGSAGSVGFDDFTEPAKLLEAAALEQNEQQCLQYIAQIHALTQRLQPAGGQVITHELA